MYAKKTSKKDDKKSTSKSKTSKSFKNMSDKATDEEMRRITSKK